MADWKKLHIEQSWKKIKKQKKTQNKTIKKPMMWKSHALAKWSSLKTWRFRDIWEKLSCLFVPAKNIMKKGSSLYLLPISNIEHISRTWHWFSELIIYYAPAIPRIAFWLFCYLSGTYISKSTWLLWNSWPLRKLFSMWVCCVFINQ